MTLSRLSLRWRLVVAFLLVSAPPVLVASYVAAAAISAVFQYNVERWLEETARFLAQEAREAQAEADKSAGIISATLARAGELSSVASVQPFADLLAAAGYDVVRIYDERGDTQYVLGDIALAGPAPREQRAAIFSVWVGGAARLAAGAVRPFELGGKRHFIFVANVLDEKFFTVSEGIKSLSVRVFRVESRELQAVDGSAADSFPVPNGVPPALLAGAPSARVLVSAGDELATAFAALRNDGDLIGVIACRVSLVGAGYERLSQWRVFAALALAAGALSMLVGFFVAKRISRPVRALTTGVRAVAAGDYRARVRAEGGREIEELATGFNVMSEQLERLHAMESGMRHSAQLAALGEAAAVIAHEIRNPLGIIKTSSQVVRMKSALRPAEDRLVGFVLEEVARIDRLVQDILDYARPIESQKMLLNLVRDVVARAIELLQPELKKHSITCAVVGADSEYPVLGDPDHLYQAVLNLVLNAIDAMPGGGRLTIEIARDGRNVELRVEDDGHGISPEVRDRIFDPFFTTKAKGTGLGLAKTKAIVEEHGGTLSCSMMPGRGAAFTIRLPLTQPEEAQCGRRSSS